MSPRALFNRTLGDILQKKSASLNFKVMDVYEEGGGPQIFLLHIPAKAVYSPFYPNTARK